MTFQGEQTLLILGASGDLAMRLLVPGLGSLIASGAAEGVSLVGSAADDWNDERWRSRVAESFAAAGATGERIDAVADFEPLMSAEHVESVDIVFDETLGLEGRAGYYEGTGTLIDMFQSHLLQVMSVVAMDPPSTIGERDVRDAKAAILRACTVRDGDPVANSYRARYTAGEVDGRRLPSYADEDGIPGDSTTETLAEVVLAIDTWRWAGVPFRLRSGKALVNPRQEVVVNFKRAAHIPTGLTGGDHPGRLHVGIALDAGRVALDLNVNGPGDPREINPVTIDTGVAPGELREYGEVLRSILTGDPILSVRGDMAVETWRIIEPVIEAWRDDRVPLEEYPAGSTGPDGWPLSGVSPGPASVATPQRVAAGRNDG
jgi:glucose-6-phosphate 1-dehydrogenase